MGSAIWAFAKRHELRAENTYWPGRSFTGPRGEASRPDAVLLPRELAERARWCGPVFATGHRLQLDDLSR